MLATLLLSVSVGLSTGFCEVNCVSKLPTSVVEAIDGMYGGCRRRWYTSSQLIEAKNLWA